MCGNDKLTTAIIASNDKYGAGLEIAKKMSEKTERPQKRKFITKLQSLWAQ